MRGAAQATDDVGRGGWGRPERDVDDTRDDGDGERGELLRGDGALAQVWRLFCAPGRRGTRDGTAWQCGEAGKKSALRQRGHAGVWGSVGAGVGRNWERRAVVGGLRSCARAVRDGREAMAVGRGGRSM